MTLVGFLYTLLELVNAAARLLIGLVLGPLCRIGPWAGMLGISLLVGAGALWVIKRVSNQGAVRSSRNRMVARVLELVLYRDDFAGAFGNLGRILWAMGPYLKENLKPLAVLIVPLVLVMTQMAAWYAWQPLRPGTAATVTVQLDEEHPVGATPLALDAPDGVALETEAVRVPRLNQVSWRVRGTDPVSGILTVTGSGETVGKHLAVSDGTARVSPTRLRSGLWALLTHPWERRLPTHGAVQRIDIDYPAGVLEVAGYRVHWLVAFFVLTLAFALLLRAPLRVEL